MAGVEIKAALVEAPEFVAEAVEHLRSCLGEEHPTVLAGRRVMASLAAIPDDAVLVTETTLAAAIHRAWPYRQKTQSNLALSAASIIAALRAER
jgi:hypothetical protein